MSDDSRNDLIVSFNDVVIFPPSTVDDEVSYSDSFSIARIASNGIYKCANNLAINVYSEEEQRFGLKANIRISVSNAVASDTFIFTARGIGITRNDSFNNKILWGSLYDKGFSESMHLVSGNKSSIFTPGAGIYKALVSDKYLSVSSANLSNSFLISAGNERQAPGIIGNGGEDGSYDNGLAVAGDANKGIIMHTHSSGGFGMVQNAAPRICLLPGEVTHPSTSLSGIGGKIELWSDGQINNNATKLAVSTANQKRTFDVPNGKAVTYKITPDEGYLLEELKADVGEGLAVVEPTRTIYKGDGVTIDHYEFDFSADLTVPLEIQASWRALNNAAVNNPQTGDELVAAAVILFLLSTSGVVAISRSGRRSGNR